MRVLIKGYYGHDNLGDDYILYSILNSLNTVGKFDVSIVSAGNKYKNFFERFQNLRVFEFCNEWRGFSKRIELVRCNLWIIGGGGLWPGEKSKNVYILLDEIRFAKKFGAKICIYGVDINSINEPENREAWKGILDEVDLFIVRNSKTKYLLDGLKENNVIKSSDITFGLVTPDEKLSSRSILDKIGIKEKSYILWSIPMEFVEGKKSKRYNTFVKTLQNLANKSLFSNYVHVFLPFNYNKDLVLMKDIAAGINGQYIICDKSLGLSIEDKRMLFKYARSGVFMRFHSVMFALYNCIPGVFISYSDKTSDVLTELDMESYFIEYGIKPDEDFCREFDLDEDKVISMANLIIEDDNVFQEKLKKSSNYLKKQASSAKEKFELFLEKL